MAVIVSSTPAQRRALADWMLRTAALIGGAALLIVGFAGGSFLGGLFAGAVSRAVGLSSGASA